MSDMIYRDDAIKVIEQNDYRLQGCGTTYEIMLMQMREVPSADRPKGRWIYDRYDSRGVNRCSECGAKIKGYGEDIPFPNCPYCLARMKGADDE